jgi:hypothetical protein
MSNAIVQERRDFYVYVYIDPRNYEEFYYGKGCGGRMHAHKEGWGESEKAKRIQAIRKEGEEPIIRVIAKGLSENEALLVETVLIWKQGRYLTNLSPGNYSTHFRPPHRMHVRLPDFDFFNSIFYANVSEGDQRSWEDCRRFGFLAAGGGRNWSEQLDRLNPGDIVVAYLKGSGYAGVGIVTKRSVRANHFYVRGKSIPESELNAPRLYDHAGDPELAQYLVGIRWKKTVPANEAKFRRNAGLYTPQRVVASLANQPKTRKFIEEAFGVSLAALANLTAIPIG